MDMRHGQLEDLITVEGRDLSRRLFEEHIRLRGVGDIGSSVVGSDGVKRTHKRVRKRTLFSVFGPITVERMGYSSKGKNSLFPKDATLNLPRESYSHGVRKLIAREASKSSFDEALTAVKHATGIRLPKGTAEELARKAAADFDNFYQRQHAEPAVSMQSLPLVVLTTDGKGVVMRREDLREATRKRAEQAKHKLAKRTSRGEKTNAKRMATVASVYCIDRFVRSSDQIINELHSVESTHHRPRPVNKRVWASLEKTPEEVTDTMFEEALRRDPAKQKKWVCLIDGDPRQVKRIRTMAKKHAVSLTIIMDVIHVIEYLWKAARVFYEETDVAAEKWVTDRLLAILERKVGHVAAGMRRSATLRKISSQRRGPIETCAGYLLKNKQYLQYHIYLREGFPIATGVIEGACRHLIKDRMDVTGARWSLRGAEAIIKLRSLMSSGDFEDYWQFHMEQEYARNHCVQYKDPLLLEA